MNNDHSLCPYAPGDMWYISSTCLHKHQSLARFSGSFSIFLASSIAINGFHTPVDSSSILLWPTYRRHRAWVHPPPAIRFPLSTSYLPSPRNVDRGWHATSGNCTNDNRSPRCNHHTEDGEYSVFHCPTYQLRRAYMGPVATWEDLEARRWIQEGEDDPWDAVENFLHIFTMRLVAETDSPR